MFITVVRTPNGLTGFTRISQTAYLNRFNPHTSEKQPAWADIDKDINTRITLNYTYLYIRARLIYRILKDDE